MTPEKFVTKWKGATLRERQAAQSHWNDLCSLLQRPKPAEFDQHGESYCFEKGVQKSGGGAGWADVWFKDHFAVEYKGPEKDLAKAYAQLQRYHDWLGHPPLLIVTDTQRFEVHTKFTRTAPRVFRFTLEDFLGDHPVAVETGEEEPPKYNALEVLRLAFDDPDRLKPALTTDRVTQDAADNFATIAQSMRDRGLEPHTAAHFLMKVLFCLFAEDVGLLPDKLFERIIEGDRNDPESLCDGMEQLFTAMRKGGRFGADRIKHFNGALFDEQPAIEMTVEEIAALRVASKLDWAHIEPSIFGTLFERSLDPNQRAQLGAHYTGYEDIMLVVEPVILRPLRREWEAMRDSLQPVLVELEELREKLATLPAARGRAKQGTERAKVERRFKKLRDQVDAAYSALLDRLRHVKILDPACGSGNFLYVALSQLKDLEKRVIQEAFALKLDLTQQAPMVDPSQLYGLELNTYAHELAQVVVWIGYIQWHVRNSYSFPENPILKPLNNIQCKDALLVWRDGKPTTRRTEWPTADFIIGNPPFLGDKKMRGGLGDEYVDVLRKEYDGDVGGGADLSVYWHEHARAMIEAGQAKRAGLLATQGIRGGANQRTLKRILQTGNIFEAWSDKDWILAGANVHVSIVCQDAGTETQRFLDGRRVVSINADLTDGELADISTAKQLAENSGIAFLGVMKAGPFELDGETARKMIAATGNPNGRSNAEVVKRRIGGQDITRRWRDGWIVDFGPYMPVEEASAYEAPFEHVRKHVYPVRKDNRRKRMKERWWLHGEARPGLRRAIAGLRRFISTPEVAKHRLFVWVPKDALPDHQTISYGREDDYFFGVLQSTVHERWSMRAGTQLREIESGFRYTPTSCFETFPFPWPPGKERANDARVQAIGAAVRELNELRENWLNPAGETEAELKKHTLTNLYNKRPEWLHLAHLKLDRAVLAAYGWQDLDPADLYAILRPNPGETPEEAKARQSAAEEKMLGRLLALNHRRANV